MMPSESIKNLFDLFWFPIFKIMSRIREQLPCGCFEKFGSRGYFKDAKGLIEGGHLSMYVQDGNLTARLQASNKPMVSTVRLKAEIGTALPLVGAIRE